MSRSDEPAKPAAEACTHLAEGDAGEGPGPAPVRHDSRTLFGRALVVEILHGGQVYRLRHTAQGKLILTK